MTYRPKYSFLRSFYYLFLIFRSHFISKKKDKISGKKIDVLKPRNTIIFLDADNSQGVRQFISYSGKSRKFYVESVWEHQFRNGEFKWPFNRMNVWNAIDECDKMSNAIRPVASPKAS